MSYLTVKPATSTAPITTADSFREMARSIEQRIEQLPGAFKGDSDNCPLTHRFADHTYIREIFIPAGTLVVGKIHRHSHLNFLSCGKVLVRTETGGVEELTAPLTMISPAGTKRIVLALEDTVWTTVHVTDKTEINEIEKEIIVESYEALALEGGQPCLGLPSV